MTTLAEKHDDNLLRYLDSEMSPVERETFLANLSESGRGELLGTESALQALERLPQITAPAFLISNVMAAIVPEKPPLLVRLKCWLERHPLLGWEVSGMAVAASVLFMMLAPSVFMSSSHVPPGQSPFIQAAATSGGAAQAELASFRLYAPQAHSISLIGDFNGWGSARKLSMRPQGNGVWTMEVPLPPGRYQYAFLVDGKNMATDPRAEQHVNDDFGRKNAVITVM